MILIIYVYYDAEGITSQLAETLRACPIYPNEETEPSVEH